MIKRKGDIKKLIRNLRKKSYEKNVIRRNSYLLAQGAASKESEIRSQENLNLRG